MSQDHLHNLFVNRKSTSMGHSGLADSFVSDLKSTFDHPFAGWGHDVIPSPHLPGSHSVADYAVIMQFWTFVATGWNAQALLAVYVQGLSEELKDELAVHNPPEDLEALYDLSVRIDYCRINAITQKDRPPMSLNSFGLKTSLNLFGSPKVQRYQEPPVLSVL